MCDLFTDILMLCDLGWVTRSHLLQLENVHNHIRTPKSFNTFTQADLKTLTLIRNVFHLSFETKKNHFSEFVPLGEIMNSFHYQPSSRKYTDSVVFCY